MISIDDPAGYVEQPDLAGSLSNLGSRGGIRIPR